MNEFWLFICTMVVGGVVLMSGDTLEITILRIGLWMIAVDRKEAERIIEYKRTGRIRW